jgi:hypothetical protein
MEVLAVNMLPAVCPSVTLMLENEISESTVEAIVTVIIVVVTTNVVVVCPLASIVVVLCPTSIEVL